MLQLVSMLRRLTRRDRLANVTMDSLSRSVRGWVWMLGRIDIWVLGANDVSAVSAMYELLSALFSPLRIDRVLVVDPWEATSFNGTVLTLSERKDPVSLPSMLATDGVYSSGRFSVLWTTCLPWPWGCSRSGLSSDEPRVGPWTNRLTHPKRPRACRLSTGMSGVSVEGKMIAVTYLAAEKTWR